MLDIYRKVCLSEQLLQFNLCGDYKAIETLTATLLVVIWISAELLMFTSCRCVNSSTPPVFCIWLEDHLRGRHSFNTALALFFHEYSTANVCFRLHTGSPT